MKINRTTLLKTILAHDFTLDFLQFVDYIHQHNTAYEFPQRLYVQFYQSKIQSQHDEALKNIMSLEALMASHFFTHEDKNAGMIGLSKVLYDMLVFLDTSRGREFSQHEFENLRRDMARTVQSLMTYATDSQDYQESFVYFNKIIARTLAELKQNIEILNAKVDEITALYQQYDAGHSSLSIHDLYDQANHLYHRHILPCLEFVSPVLQLQQTHTFIQSLEQLYAFFDSTSQLEYAILVQYRLTAVSSYYKDIQQCAKKLQHYLSSIAKERKDLLLIERAYQDLVATLEPLQHGREKNRFLEPHHNFFQYFQCFDGLFDFKRRYSARFNRTENSEHHLIDFQIYLEQLKEKPITVKAPLLQPLPVQRTLEQQREHQILTIIATLEVPSQLDDLYQFIYDELQQHLPQCTLIDLLYGIDFLLPLLDSDAIYFAQQRQQLCDDRYFYDYAVLSYTAQTRIGE